MSEDLIIGGIVATLSAIAFVVFGFTKKEGFGPYNVSTLLLLVALSLTASLAAGGVIDGDHATSIFLAIIGFATGLFVGKCNR